ncbi:MAG: sigma-70 family RNA polymerase sigma factor, partial [Edaphobacter sp.]
EPLEGPNEPVIYDHYENIDIARHLKALPEIQREVITLFYLQEKSIDDVAELLDLPSGTVKSHLHRARRALTERMKL